MKIFQFGVHYLLKLRNGICCDDNIWVNDGATISAAILESLQGILSRPAAFLSLIAFSFL
jgi:hypothetical protein